MRISQIKRAHFIAIGGVGMSGIAWVLLDRGIAVSGSDLSDNRMIRRLTARGAHCFAGHRPEQVDGADVVIVSTAIKEDNCELAEARRRGIPVWHRSQALGAILNEGHSIGITGSHGKTTTTSMVGTIFDRAGLDPTIIVGGESDDFGGTAKAGKSEYVIAELDESDGSFLGLSAHRAIITNIDAEHLDHYSNYAGVIGAFQRFIRQVEEPPVVCIDDPGVRELLEGTTRPVIRYSLSDPSADYLAAEIDVSNQDSRFVVVRDEERLGTVILPARGRHNISNAMGAIAMAVETGVDPKVVCEALNEYRGVQRRFTIRSEPAGILIVDDYGHHPSEINATLAVGREWADERNGRLIVVFQPHRFTRTAALTQRFGGAFSDADQVIVTGIYAAGEKPIDGVTGQLIADSVRESGQVNIEYVERRDAVAERLAPMLQTGDVVITLGAGDVWRVGDELEERIEANAVASASPLMERREATTGRETV